MLEKIGLEQWKAISTPCPDFFIILDDLLSRNIEPVLAEIWIGLGATTRKTCERLQNTGIIHVFDFAESVEELKSDLNRLGFENVVAHGNSRKQLDSYAWSLAQLAIGDDRPAFDLVFLDGAHNFVHDAPASLTAAEMIKPGGYILFDDLAWTYNKSPSMNPKVNTNVGNWFTDEQLQIPQVQLVCDIFFETSPRFERILELNGTAISRGRALYRKLSG